MFMYACLCVRVYVLWRYMYMKDACEVNDLCSVVESGIWNMEAGICRILSLDYESGIWILKYGLWRDSGILVWIWEYRIWNMDWYNFYIE